MGWEIGSTNRFCFLLLIPWCKSAQTILKSWQIKSHSRSGACLSKVPGALLKERSVSQVKAALPFSSCIPVCKEQEQVTFKCYWITAFWEKPDPHLLLQKQGISARYQVSTSPFYAIYLQFCLQSAISTMKLHCVLRLDLLAGLQNFVPWVFPAQELPQAGWPADCTLQRGKQEANFWSCVLPLIKYRNKWV